MEFTTVKGFRDILPEEIPYWKFLEEEARKIFERFGFREIRTPIVEKTELFKRSIGQETDIVSKEMYTFQDSKGRSLSLRPEATASVVRAYIQNRLYQKGIVQKLYSIGPMFRHERPQKGRLRQFHQINVEVFGDPGPMIDAEIMIMIMKLFEKIGLKEDVSLNINSLGCPSCRSSFRERLKKYLSEKNDKLCPDCQRRSKVNPLRVFDCKIESCKESLKDAPVISDYLCEDCRRHFSSVQEILKRFNVEFYVNPRLVRGLDYYTRTTFELLTEGLGAQNAVAGGGRYDGLVKLLGGPDQPAIGFAIGMERTVELLKKKKEVSEKTPDLFICTVGSRAKEISFSWMLYLREKGLWVEMNYGERSLKSQMKLADRLKAKKVLIIGEDEIKKGSVILRDMKTGEQKDIEMKIESIYSHITSMSA